SMSSSTRGWTTGRHLLMKGPGAGAPEAAVTCPGTGGTFPLGTTTATVTCSCRLRRITALVARLASPALRGRALSRPRGPSRAAAVRQDPALVAREAALVAHLKKLGALQVDTCINYQTVYQPRFGEHLAWGDTGTVIWANSVTGARTNYEAGPAAVAAGLTGVTPAYGYHLDAQRAGTLRFEVRCALNDYADWGALGGIIGRRTLDYWK